MKPRPTSQSNYQVRKYDSLWKIAQSQYGDGRLWPEIARANALPLADQIFVGQTIQLPDLSMHRPTFARPPLAKASPQKRPALLSSRLPAEANAIAYPAFKFKLPLIKQSFRGPGYVATFKMEGEFVIQKKGVLEGYSITDFKQIEAKYKSEYQNELARLGSELKLKFDPQAKKLEFEGAITHTIRFKGKDWLSYEISMPTPKTLVFSMKPSPVEGQLRDALLKGEVGYELRIDFLNPIKEPAYQLTRPIVFAFDLRPFFVALTLVLVVAILAVSGVQLAIATAVCVVAFLIVKQLIERQPTPIAPLI